MPKSTSAKELKAAWVAAPPVPNLRNFLQADQSDEAQRELIDTDVRARRVRGLPATLDVYVIENPDLFAPDCTAACAVIYHELAANYNDPKTAAKQIRNRYGNRYRAAIDKALDWWGQERRAAANKTTPIAAMADETLPERIGRYRITRVIGRGGMGVVYEAQQDAPSRRVAVKVIRLSGEDPMAARRFTKEMETLARIEHPNVARIYDAGTATIRGEERPYFVMELVEGVPLDTYLANNDLPLRKVIKLLIDLCQAVHHAHQRGVIHRDVKPANVLVTSDGKPVVLDFGVARLADENIDATIMEAEIGQLVGTIPFMAPEQTYGDPQKIDLRVDVYALGILAYQGLANRHPHDFRNKAMLELVRTIREDAPTPLAKAAPEVPPDIETIVHKAMAKDPERRYQSASELAADLTRYLKNQPIAARPPSAWYQMRKFTQRNRALVSAGLLAVLALIGGIASTSIGLLRAKEAEAQAVSAQEATERQKNKTQRLANKLADKLYASTIQQAQLEISSGNLDNSRELLNGCQPELREWEWRYLNHATSPKHKRLAHRHDAWSVAVSRDHKIFASRSGDNIVRIFSATDPESKEKLVVDVSPRHLLFGADGQQLFVSYPDGTLTAWDLDTKKKTWSSKNRAFNNVLELTADGKSVLSIWHRGGPEGPLRHASVLMTDVATGALTNGFRIPAGVPQCLCILSDDRIIVGDKRKLYCYDPKNPKKQAAQVFTLKNDALYLSAASEAPFFAVASRNGQVTVLDANTYNVILKRTFPAPVLSLAFSSDGKKIAAGAFSGILTQPLAAGAAAYRAQGVEAGCSPIMFVNDNTSIVACDDKGLVMAPDAPHEVASTRPAHSSPLTRIRFSRNGSQMGTVAAGPKEGDGDSYAHVWNPNTLQTTAKLQAHPRINPLRPGAYDLAFHPHKRELATVGADRTLKIWNRETKSQIVSIGRSWNNHPSGVDPIGIPKTLNGDFTSGVRCVDYHPNGKRIATGSENGDLSIWSDVGEPIATLQPYPSAVYSTTFHPDGKHFAVSSRKSVIVYDVATRKRIKTIVPFRRNDVWSIAEHYCNATAFNASGNILAIVASGSKYRTICLYSWPDATLIRVLKLSAPAVYSIAFNPHDNRILVTGGLGYAELWDGDTGTRLRTFKGHTNHVVNAAWHPDNPYQCATAGFDGHLVQWDARTGERISTVRGQSPLDVAYSPDGKTLAASHKNRLVLYDADSGRKRRLLCTAASNVRRLSYSPDGSQIAAGCDNGSIMRIDVSSGKIHYVKPLHTNQVKGISHAPNGRLLVSGSSDGSVYLLQSMDSAIIFEDKPEGSAINRVAYSPDGKHLITSGYGGHATVWNAQTNEKIANWKRHAAFATYFDLSRDGSILATRGSKKLIIADFPSGNVRHEIVCNAAPVAGPAVSPDGQRVAIADVDRRIRVFSTESGQEVLRAALENHLWSLAFGPDGHHLYGGDVNGNLRILKGSAP